MSPVVMLQGVLNQMTKDDLRERFASFVRKENVSILTVTFGIVVVLLINMHYAPMNGPKYWEWKWRSIGFFPALSHLILPFMLYCYAFYSIGRAYNLVILVLLTVSNFLLQLSGIMAEPLYSYKAIFHIVSNPITTSYYTDALKISDLNNWFEHFNSQQLELHSRTHPPGPILFYYATVKLFGTYYGAFAGAIIIGALGSASVLFLYFFASLWGLESRTRLTICAYYALIPALVLFFPEFDQIYPLFAMLMLYLWHAVLNRSANYLLPFSVASFICIFFAYNLLTIGMPLALMSLYYVYSANDKTKALWRLSLHTTVAITVFAAFHYALYLATGHNSAIAFTKALQYQNSVHFSPPRLYSFTIFTDMYDFILGSGYLTIPLLALFISKSVNKNILSEKHLTYSFLGLISIAAIDLTGLLRCETARVWLFLQPFIVIPAGIELSRLKRRSQFAVLLVLFFILTSIKANMLFVGY